MTSNSSLRRFRRYSRLFLPSPMISFFLILLSLRRKARGDPRVPWSAFAWRLRCGGNEFALILAMLLRPCLGQAMVCMVVLSAAALASQTHYSYLNEFSLLPRTLLPHMSAPIPLSLSPRQLCILWPQSFISMTNYFRNNVPVSPLLFSRSFFSVYFIDRAIPPFVPSRSAFPTSYIIRIHVDFVIRYLVMKTLVRWKIQCANVDERFYASLARGCTLVLPVIIYDNKIINSNARSVYICRT